MRDGDSGSARRCPKCGQPLRYDRQTGFWWCGNAQCGAAYPQETFTAESRWPHSRIPGDAGRWHRLQSSGSTQADYASVDRTGNHEVDVKKWILPAVLAVALGLGGFHLLSPQSPVLSVDPARLSFGNVTGETPESKELTIANSGGGEFEWFLHSDVPWLVAEPITGTVADGEEPVMLGVDLQELHPGDYHVTVDVYAPGAEESPQEVTIKLAIRDTPETLMVKQKLGPDVDVFYGKQPPSREWQGNGLANNERATNPTWERLVRFLREDPTDEQTYVPNVRMCGDFAETLHNNAEASGLRCAWVGVHFEGLLYGHALNAFNTRDRGLVFIDCTGEQPVPLSLADEGMPEAERSECEYDTVAYVLPDREYGIVPIQSAESFSYDFYEDYLQRWEILRADVEEYNRDVEEYNARVREYEDMIGGRTVIRDKGEYEKLEAMRTELQSHSLVLDLTRDQLERERRALGYCYFQPMGTVSYVDIYW